jgi:hypothetical protein
MKTIPATAPEITRIHDRQPAVLLGRERLDAWLDESVDAEDALALIEPLPADVVEVWPVDPAINKATEQDAELLEPYSTRCHVSGRLAVRMDDGTEIVAGPGDITSLPPGHDGWVVGDEPVVVIDWYGAGNFAKGD